MFPSPLGACFQTNIHRDSRTRRAGWIEMVGPDASQELRARLAALRGQLSQGV